VDRRKIVRPQHFHRRVHLALVVGFKFSRRALDEDALETRKSRDAVAERHGAYDAAVAA
jgi:hypothetical protein